MYEAFFVSYFPMEQAEKIAVFLNPYAFGPLTSSPGSILREIYPSWH